MPTLQFPQLDACPLRHGVWLDAGELNLFVDQTAIYSSAMEETPMAVQTTCLCPRCAVALDEYIFGSQGGYACRACRGYWLAEGVLTALHKTYAVDKTTDFDEPALYARAQKIQTSRKARLASDSEIKRRSSANLLYWCAFGTLIALVLSIVIWESLRRTVAQGQWSGRIDEGFFLFALGAVGGIALFIQGFRVHREKRFIEGTPTSTIRSLALGLVEITGQAETVGSLLSAPFSAMPCVFYFYTVEERQRHGKTEKWVTIAKGESPQPFAIRDATGVVTILPIGATLLLATKATYQNIGHSEFSPALQTGLNALGISTEGWLETRTIRCTEGFIVPNETIYLLGTAQEGDQEQSENNARLFIGSDPHAPFLISDRKEHDLIRTMQWQLAGLLFGGPALTAACLWALLNNYIRVAR